jgi:hypothetical protein
MSTILSSDEMVRRAVLWISEQRKADPSLSVIKLAQEASARFDLSPIAEQWLLETFAKRDAEPPVTPR